MKGILVLLFIALVAGARGQVEQCPTEQETDWTIEMLLRHEECHKFYKCAYGKPVEYTCPDTGGGVHLYFNLEKWECDWQDNVDCTGRVDPALTTAVPDTTEPTTPEPTTTTSTTTTPAPTTTTTTTTTPAPTTTTTTTTTLAPTTTTTTTTTPAPTTTTTTTTPAPTTTTTTTTPAPTTTTTTPEPTTTTTTTTTPEPTTTTTTTTHAPECEVIVTPTPAPEPDTPEEGEVDCLPNGCPVDPHIHRLLPHETECNKFYYCVWGEKVLRECSSVLFFNPILQVCDWPQNAGCAVSMNKHANARRQLLNQILL